MESSSVQNIDSLKNEIKEIAIKNVLTKFPEKIVELSAFLSDERLQNEFDVTKDELISELIPEPDLKDVQKVDTNSEDSDESNVENLMVSKTVNTSVVCSNRYLVEIVTLLRPQMMAFIGFTLELSAGINLLIPPIEDGNNFGVEIQEECIGTIITAENDIYHRLQEIHKYFQMRAELVTKAIKNPKCEDFRLAIQERDRLFHKFLIISFNCVRNSYINLHDLVVKNMNKIQKPKSRISNEMY